MITFNRQYTVVSRTILDMILVDEHSLLAGYNTMCCFCKQLEHICFMDGVVSTALLSLIAIPVFF